MRVAISAVVLGSFVSGCAARGATASEARAPDSGSSRVIEVAPQHVTPHDDARAEARFLEGRALLASGSWLEAAAIFDEVARSTHDDEVVAPSLANAGLAWQAAGDREKALARFVEARDRYPSREAGRVGAVEATRLFAYLERWPELSASADGLLARGDLAKLARVEALGQKALALVEIGDDEGAARTIARARDLIDESGLAEASKLPVEAAQVFFALGEVRRTRAERLKLDSAVEGFGAQLEQRCQALLDAQGAYTDAMRAYDAHVSAMSGFRVGELYQRLHAEVTALAPPAAATTDEKRRLFEGAMRLRYRVLLEKGLRMMDHTVMLAERTGEASAWIDRAREAKKALEASLDETKRALAKLPWGEADLQRALDDLGRGAAAKVRK